MSQMFEPKEESIGLLAQDEHLFEKNFEPLSPSMGVWDRLSRMVVIWLHLCIDLVKRTALFAIPSFISARWLGGPSPVDPPEKLRPTAYLDGLRGVAAWSVFNAHLSAVLVKHSGAGWGHGGDDLEFWKLPIIRLFFKGDFAVGLFFVISGYALSISPILAMRKAQRDPGTAMAKLSSAIFRRPFRLFVPSWVSIFVVFILIRLDFFTYLVSNQAEYETVVHGWPLLQEWPQRMPSFYLQFREMLLCCAKMLHIFVSSYDPEFHPSYNGVLWTVKLEFRASMVLYMTHGALYYMNRRTRIIVVSILILIGWSVWCFDCPLFWAGYLIAEISTLNKPEPAKGLLVSLASWIAVLVGSYLGSWPGWDTINTPSHAWIERFTPFGFLPASYLWCGIGAILVIWGMRNIPIILSFYHSAVIQYLGKISFALYLVHFWIVQGLGTVIYYHVWSFTGRENVFAETIGFFISYAILMAITVCVSDVFWRAVDIPSVKGAMKVQKFLFTEK